MTNRRSLWTLAIPVVGAVLATAGCARTAVNPPPDAPVPAAALAPSAQPTPKPVAASPSINVSDELVTACKLRFDDAESAPKFELDRSQLLSQDNEVLSQIAICVTTGPLAGHALDLVGRADPRGEAEYNMALGERRASSVRDSLSHLGVDGSKLGKTSRGKLDATGTDESGWSRDRRVDISLH